MYRTFLSLRFLRHRLTNLIGVSGIFLAVGALILILSIMTGFLDQTRRTIRGSLSDLVLSVPPVSSTTRPSDPAPLLDIIRANDKVAAAAAHMVSFCILTKEGSDASVITDSQAAQIVGIKLTGIDVADEVAATEFEDSLVRESKFREQVHDPADPFAPPPEYDASVGRPRASVIVGEQVLEYHRLRRGSLISLMTAVPDPEAASGWSPKKREFVVAGTFRTRENEMDLERVYIDRGQLARFLAGVSEDEPLPAGATQYSEILVKLHDYGADGEAARREIGLALYRARYLDDPRQIRTWEEFRESLIGAIENERALMGIMLALILLVSGFTIFAILSMMVTEKRRDIGILTALGATPRGVLALFLLIGFWDALIGATLGAVVGVWMAIKIDPLELWLSDTFGVQIFNRNVYIFDTIPSVVTPVFVALIVLGAFACTLVFAAIPAWRAASLDPVEALRNE